MAEDDQLEGTPYFFAGRRSFKEAELLSYIRREHRKGRHLGEIIDDPFVHSLGSRNFVWQTLRDTPLIELLDEDVREAIQRESADVSKAE
jgi:hypothetical protein